MRMRMTRLMLCALFVLVATVPLSYSFTSTRTAPPLLARVVVVRPGRSHTLVPPSFNIYNHPVRQHQQQSQNKNKNNLIRLHSQVTTADNAAELPAEEGGTSTATASIFNLVKGIVGAGVLSLPAGVAAFGNAPSAVIPAVILIACIGTTSAYCFSLIGRVCYLTGATSYREAWNKSVGDTSSLLPAVSVTLKTACAVLAYSMILADTFTSLFQTVGMTSMTRTRSLLALTSCILLPLCWLKNLSSLAPFSLLGSLGMGYTAIAMALRYFQKAYNNNVGQPLFVVTPKLTPSFGHVGMEGALSPNVFILICMLSTAFMAHFNAPKFYTELKNNTVERFNKVVYISFAIAILLFASITSVGYLTFGAATDGLILNNYSTRDVLMNVSRVAVAISLVFSYPLAFVGVREGLLDLFQVKNRTIKTLNTLTVATLSVITYAALKVKDVSFVLAFAGATLGNALIYVFPALMFRGTVQKMTNPTPKLKRESKLALVTASLGVIFGCVGAKMALRSLG